MPPQTIKFRKTVFLLESALPRFGLLRFASTMAGATMEVLGPRPDV
jgi:hypothetical protein